MRVPVHRGEVLGGRQRDCVHLVGRYDRIEKSCLPGSRRIEHGTCHCSVVEVRGAEAVAGDDDRNHGSVRPILTSFNPSL